MTNKGNEKDRTPKEKLNDFLCALDVFSFACLVAYIRLLNDGAVEEEEKEKMEREEREEKILLYTAGLLVSLPIYRRRTEKSVRKFLGEWDIEEILERAFAEVGGSVEEARETAQDIISAINAIPPTTERTARTVVQRVGMSEHYNVYSHMEEYAERGIQAVQYTGGRRTTPENFARTAVNNKLHEARLQSEAREREREEEKERVKEEEFIQEHPLETPPKHESHHLVYAAIRREACPKCLGWLGRILFDDYFSEAVNYTEYPSLSEAVEQGFLHPNCKDTIRTYRGENIRPMTAEEIKTAEELYKKDQYKKYCERNIKKYKALEEGTNKEHYKKMRERWEERRKEEGEKKE